MLQKMKKQEHKTYRICKSCKHSGSMHTDGVHYTHIGECMQKVGKGFCKCKEFKE